MDKVTQSGAGGAEEAASAAEELSAQAQNVRNMVAELVVLAGGSNGGVASPGNSGTQPGNAYVPAATNQTSENDGHSIPASSPPDLSSTDLSQF